MSAGEPGGGTLADGAPATSGFSIREPDSSEIDWLLSALADLYRATYAEPPYHEGEQHVAAFVERFTVEAASPGFRLVVAETGEDQVIGFAHGLTFPAGTWWGDADHEPPEVRGVPTFAVMEFIVSRPERGRGIGTALMTALLEQRPEPYATLCANPAASARQIYHRWGWRPVAVAHTEIVGTMDVLLLDLAAYRSARGCGER
ncbi:MAG: GNAT family N-acetyltransferase [Micromonosporaceae bacterium]|nr:GNAT family N-acetyltransferase [Micromonosporaceae bacterium]